MFVRPLAQRTKPAQIQAMAGRKPSVERRGQPSHREDLRNELLAAATAIVTREGHEGLSIRRLAEEVGVSPGAPYHHFPDRRALLTAVALNGYQELLAQTVPATSADKSDGPLAQTLANFVRFAVDNPHMFTLMYESELVRPRLSPELAAAHEEGFQFMRNEVKRLAGNLSEREVAIRVATIWSAVFGFALQSNRAMLRPHSAEPAPGELAPEIIRQALRLLS